MTPFPAFVKSNMLIHSTHSRNAFEPPRNPFREARLLWFANDGTGGGSSGEDLDEEETIVEIPETMRPDDVDTMAHEQQKSLESVINSTELRERVEKVHGTVQTASRIIGGLTEEQKHMDKLPELTKKEEMVIQNMWNILSPKSEAEKGEIQKRAQEFFLQQRTNLHEEMQESNEMKKVPEISEKISVIQESIAIADTLTETIDQFSRNELPPQTFIEEMSRYWMGQQDENIIQEINQVASRYGDEISQWGTCTATTQEEIIYALKQAAEVPEILQGIQEDVEFWEEKNKELTDLFFGWKQGGSKRRKDHGYAPNLESSGMFSGMQTVMDRLGIAFYSPNQVIDAFKQFGTEWGKTFELWNRRKSAGLAEQVGETFRWLPGGQSVLDRLKDTTRRADEEEINRVKEGMIRDNIFFNNLFESGGRLERAQGRPLEARGVLEYAASKGWLYDLHTTGGGEHATIYGLWNLQKLTGLSGADFDNYLAKLRSTNKQGETSEKEAGKGRAEGGEKAHMLVDVLGQTLDEVNFWQMLGAAEMAMKTGKAGEMAAWLAVTLMRKMQENPLLRKYVTARILEQIKTFTLGKSAIVGLLMIRQDQDEVESWAKSGDPERLEDSGTLGKAMSIMEREIKEKREKLNLEPLDQKTLDQNIAKTLSGAPLKIENKKTGETEYVTILENMYKEYRSHFLFDGYSADQSIRDEDPDYFLDYSAQMMGNAGTWRSELAQVNGSFTNKERSWWFGTKVIADDVLYQQLIEDLERQGKMAEANHQREGWKRFRAHKMENLTEWMSSVLQDSRCHAIASYKTDKTMIKALLNVSAEQSPLLGTMAKRGLIPLDFLEKFAFDEHGNNQPGQSGQLARELLEDAKGTAIRCTELKDFALPSKEILTNKAVPPSSA